MSTIENIYQFIDYKGISVSDFSNKVSVSNGYFAKQRTAMGAVSSNIIEKIVIQYPEINAGWLITGQGNMLNEDTKEYSPVSVRRLRTDKNFANQDIPLYDLKATASAVALFGSSKAKIIPIDFIRVPGLPKCDGAIPIMGDSMYPLLKSGDIVMYKEIKDIQTIIPGEMYLIFISHEGDDYFFTKYLHRSEREGYIKLVSENKHHAPIEFPIMSIKNLAIIKASIRINHAV